MFGPTSVVSSEGEVNVRLDMGRRWKSDDCWIRREFGVDWRFGKRVRERRNWERTLTWKWESEGERGC